MPKRILVAEDSRVARKILKNIIESESDHEVVLADDGVDAWEKLSNPTQTYDLCISDLIMPRLDGFGLIEKIRKTNWLKDMPVVLCTAVKDRAALQRALSLGIRYYILKPYSATDVLTKVHKAMTPPGSTNIPFPATQAAATRAQLDATIGPAGKPAENTSSPFASRLGFNPAAQTEFLIELVGDIRKWIEKLSAVSPDTKTLSLATEANSFRGVCLILELSSLAEHFFQVEKQLVLQIGRPASEVVAAMKPTTQLLVAEVEKIKLGTSVAQMPTVKMASA